MNRKLLACFVCVFFPLGLRAQSTHGSLGGRVTDPSGAVIGDAKVSATGADTNVRYETATGLSGSYYLATLPPGIYEVEIDKPGFRKSIRPNVTVHVQDALEIDFEMTIGAPTESVTVEADVALAVTESGTVSTLVDRSFVENLPLNGRSFQTLLTLTPGVVLTPTTFDDQGQFSVNGQRANANYFMVDGVSANFGVTPYIAMVHAASGALPALSASGGTNSLVSVDAMQEFRIQTSSFAPEFGRTPGGQVSIVTRSGTNAFHGSLFEYFRNSALDAKDWFVNFNRLSKPEQRLHDFGGVLGGPILKNRMFFFYSYEGLRLRQPSTQRTAVPDAAAREQAPAAVRPYLNAFPMANGPGVGAGLAEFNAAYSNPSKLDASSIRIDHVIGAKFNLFGRYNYSPSSLSQRGPFFSSGTVLSTTNSNNSDVHTATFGFTALISPRISNEFRANYSNQRIATEYLMDDFGGAVPLDEALMYPPGYSSGNGLFQLVIGGAGEYSHGRLGTNEQRQVNVVESVAMTQGSHQLKFGADYRWLAPFSSPAAYHQFAQFSGVTPAPGGALSGTALFAQAGAAQTNALLSQNLSFFAQDTWKVTPGFTLTYGVRWDLNPPLKGKNKENDPFTVVGLTDPSTMKLAPRGTPLYATTYGNVAPRLGLAVQLRRGSRWETTLRSGFGLFYDLGQGSLGGVTSYFPYSASKDFSLQSFPLAVRDATPPPFSTSTPVSTIIVADPQLKLPRSYQWNLAVEQTVGSHQSLSVTYLGAVGRDLMRHTNLYDANPDFPFVGLQDNSATSDYHALQVKLQRRFARGLQGLASYNFAHSIDNASTDAFATYLNSPANSGSKLDRGNSDFDLRHSFTAAMTYDLPGMRSQRALQALLSDWSFDAFLLARSAPPIDVVGSISFAAGTALASRPNINAGVPLELEGGQYPGGKIINRAAFSAAPAGQQGRFGRNVLRGFGAWQADLAVQRRFPLHENVGLRFRAEFFNVLNHANFGSPNRNLTSALFGRSTQTLANSLGSGGVNGGFNSLYQVGGPRSIQFALKLQF